MDGRLKHGRSEGVIDWSMVVLRSGGAGCRYKHMTESPHGAFHDIHGTIEHAKQGEIMYCEYSVDVQWISIISNSIFQEVYHVT